jgi:hypothetical protein
LATRALDSADKPALLPKKGREKKEDKDKILEEQSRM